MTSQEQAFAEANLHLVSNFLSFHQLPEEEYYDVVIFGYLKAVQAYFRHPIAPERQNFIALARRCMSGEVRNEWRYENRKLRKNDYPVLSLDSPVTEDAGCDFHSVIADKKVNTARRIENADLIARILAAATKREYEILRLVFSGYSQKEIAALTGYTIRIVQRALYRFRDRARAMRDGESAQNYHKRILEQKRQYRETHRKEKAASNVTSIENGPARVGL